VFIALILLIEAGYWLHGSLGKSLFGLSIEVKGRGRYYLRETFGKLASTATFGIGFLLILSKEGLALHDYIAGTRVVQAHRRSLNSRVGGALALVIGAGCAAYVGARLGSVRPTQVLPSHSPSGTGSMDLIVKKMPAVLTITVFDSQGREFGQGSGFIVKPEGIGLTNFHVLQAASNAEARLGDGRLFQILRIEAYDASKDLAVFQLGRDINDVVEWPAGLPTLPLGSSENVSVGDRVATIGSPKGLPNSVSDGLVSGVRQEDSGRFLQISAPISPGSSGGPLFDMQGNVVGVVSSQLRDAQNINFAIPVEIAVDLLERHQDLTFNQFRQNLDVTARSRRPDDFASIFEQAQKLYATGRYPEALKLYLKAQSLRPTESVLYYNAGLCLAQEGDLDNAAGQFGVYLIFAPKDDPDRKRIEKWLTDHGHQLPNESEETQPSATEQEHRAVAAVVERMWKNLRDGHTYRTRIRGDNLYLESVETYPTNLAAIVSCEFKRATSVGIIWIGTCWKRNPTDQSTYRSDAMITLFSDARIEGSEFVLIPTD